jgi:phosphoribosylformimino-5-aminoimidazole carboxamide ribotide isomerase
MELWPAIDLLGGAAVRLHQGDYEKVTVYDANPTEIAQRFQGNSPRLHVVDLEGARVGRPMQSEAIARLVGAFSGTIQVGGGIRTMEDIEHYTKLGVQRIIVGTVALKNPSLFREASHRFPGQLVLAVDAKAGMVATDGWLEVSTRHVLEVLHDFEDCPLAGVLYTDIARDGTQTGPNVETTLSLAQSSKHPVLASGGVGSLEHLQTLAQNTQIAGAIVGKALYEQVFTIAEARLAAKDV